LEQDTPSVNVELGTQATQIGEGYFEATLTVTVTSKIGEDKVVFLVEVVQAGIFQIRNVPQEELEPVLMIGCANILFPYARESISDAITRSGFQPVLLAPVNFEGLYAARQQEAAEAAALQGGADVPVQ
jgi:preprotein translocase subunit SecB